MEQYLSFSMREQERVDGLTNLLINFNKREIELKPSGGFRDGFGNSSDIKRDWANYSMFKDEKQIGSFQFDKKGSYNCKLDLNGLDETSYKNLIEIVKKEFPEIR